MIYIIQLLYENVCVNAYSKNKKIQSHISSRTLHSKTVVKQGQKAPTWNATEIEEIIQEQQIFYAKKGVIF